MPEQTKPQKSQNEIKFEILTGLELTCAALGDYYLMKDKDKEDSQIKKEIKHDSGVLLADFNRLFFKVKGDTKMLWDRKGIVGRLSQTGKYCLGVIGQQAGETDSKKIANTGLAYILRSINYVLSNDYKASSEFFGSMARKAERGADAIKF